MLHSNNTDSTLLLCTPDYPPKLGGLSTFTINIESVLKRLGLKYDLLVWSSSKELKEFLSKEGLRYPSMVHIHGLSYQLFSRSKKYSNSHVTHINFFHGSEILFQGRNFLYTAIKKLMKRSALSQFEKAYANIAISEFTLNKLISLGYKNSCDRDFIIHNAIALDPHRSFTPKSLNDDQISFVCVARPVPHKNPEGLKNLMIAYSQATYKKAKLYSSFELESNTHFDHENISGIDSEKLKDLYKKCHFNVLLSLDHTQQGFFEGFGLTVLEAGQYGTPSIVSPYGGLPEACHDLKTGWVINLDELSMRQFFRKLKPSEYSRVSSEVYRHTHESHSLSIYEKIFSSLFQRANSSEGTK